MCAAALSLWAADFVRAAAPLHGRVLHVVDGAMLDVLVGRKRTRVLLTGIEAPDASAIYSQRSRQSLIQLCGGELAEIHAAGTDREGRTLARVICNQTDANAEQVRRGMVRLSDRNATPGSPLHAAQQEARAAHRGLWAELQARP
jgi:endonuclease YncB( thermonuclease family)